MLSDKSINLPHGINKHTLVKLWQFVIYAYPLIHSTSPTFLLVNRQSFFANVRLDFTASHTIQFTISISVAHSNWVIILRNIIIAPFSTLVAFAFLAIADFHFNFNCLPHESVSKAHMIHNLHTARLLCRIRIKGNRQSIHLRTNTSHYHNQRKDFFDGIHGFERSFFHFTAFICYSLYRNRKLYLLFSTHLKTLHSQLHREGICSIRHSRIFRKLLRKPKLHHIGHNLRC